MNEVVQALMQTPLGSVLSATEAADLATAATVRRLSRGQPLFRVGDKSEALYIAIRGSLDVVLGQPSTGQIVVAQIGPGQILGELELMTSSLRVASLVAVEDTEVVEISSTSFEAMLKDSKPAAVKLLNAIAKALARRLASVNQRIVAKATPPPPATVEAEPVAVEEKDVVAAIEDEDLDVLDKIWS